MLEVVGVQGAVLQGGVGGDVVVEFHDLQGVAVFFQDLLGYFQDFRVGSGGGAYLDGAALFAAAGGEAQKQQEGQGKDRDSSFHDNVSFSIGLVWFN